MLRKLNNIQKRLIAIAALAIVIWLIMLFASHPFAVERYYSTGFYVFVCRVLHPVFNIFPFSVGDLLYVAVVCYLIYLISRLIKLLFKKQFKLAGNLLLGLTIGIESGLIIFYVFWG